MGFFGAMIFDTLWVILLALNINCEMCLYPRLFIMLGAQAKDIAASIMDFGNSFTSENAGAVTIGDRNQLMEKIIEMIRFQIEAKRFVSHDSFHVTVK